MTRTKPRRQPVDSHALARVPKPVRLPVSGSLYMDNLEDSESDTAQDTDVQTPESLAAQAQAVSEGKQAAGWDETLSQLTRVSPALTAQELLTGDPDPPYNGRFLIGEHHIEWDSLIIEHQRLCVLSPRDSGKTFFFAFAYPIWKAINHPLGSRHSGYIFSSTQPMAERILGDVKVEIETNPRLQWLLPSSKETWKASSITLANGHRIFAKGFGTKVRGAHPQYILVDDVLTDETAYSDLVRKKQIDYFYSAITNMIVPGGQIIVVGTPFAKNDLYGDLKTNKQYKFVKYQALTTDSEGKPRALWPERYPVKSLLAKREEIKNLRFGREFQCDPISDEASLFPARLFQGDPTEQPGVRLGMPLAYWQERGVTIFIGVDFAMSSSVQADYTVVWVMGKDRHGNRWIIDIHRAKGMAYQDQLSLIKKVGFKYNPASMFLEANQMQRIFGDELIRTTDLPIHKFVTGVQKHSLETGLPSLRVLLENQKFRIPRGDAHSIELTDLWIDEMQSFTWDSGKVVSVGDHDDLPMSCWICNEAIRMGGFEFTFGTADMQAVNDVNAKPDAKPKPVNDKAKPVNTDNLSETQEANLVGKEFMLPMGYNR